MRYFFAFWLCLLVAQSLFASESLQRELTLNDAKHLLNRTGFGATVDDLNRLIGVPRTEAIDSIISGISSEPLTHPPVWITKPAPHHWTRNELSKTGRRIFNESRDQEIASLRLWWIREMIETTSPQSEKLTLFWHSHFATAYSAINDQAISIARQHMMFRQLGSGTFRNLLAAVVRDPAMLNYLDNENSRIKSPNENLARELFELFTLGEGNYSESDVKNAARALTGYTTSATHNLSFQFKPGKHDSGVKTILGETSNFDADTLIDLILDQPATAEFIASKLWKLLVSDTPPTSNQLKPLANLFRDSDYDIKTLYRQTLRSDAFWQTSNRASIVHSPASLTIGAIRSTGVVPLAWQTLPSNLEQLGQTLFDPPNVAGWPGGAAWISPGRLLNRLEWLATMGNPCTGAACISQGMMNMTPDMQRPTAKAIVESGNSNNSELSVRLAADSYEGPARFRIDILNGDAILWSSPETPVSGGRDTKAYGSLPSNTVRPWQTLKFKVNANIASFDAVSVHYLNDNAGDSGDRNLFINWLMIDGLRFDAAAGTQSGKCPPKRASEAGNLYCNGALLLTSATQLTPGKSDNEQNTLRTSGVFMRTIRNPSQRTAIYDFTLTDLELDQRHWHNLTVSFQRSKDNKYRISLQNYGCWPDCLERWPPCSKHFKDGSGLKVLSVPLQPAPTNNCQYNSLSASDQKLIRSLLHNLPRFYEIAGNSKRVQRGKNLGNHKAWQPLITEIEAQYQRSKYTDKVAKLVVAPKTASRPAPLPAELITEHPLPGGRTIEQRDQDLVRLMKNKPDLTLTELLLPIDSAQPSHAQPNNELVQILTDLSFQLY